MSNDILTRLDALESRFAIESLISTYAQAFDSRDEVMLRGIWHEGAHLSLGGAFGDDEGVEAIVKSAHNNWEQMPHMHHWMSNPRIDIEGDTAAGSCAVDCHVTHIEHGPVQISGLYRDRYERRSGRWGIVERLFELHFFTPLSNWTPIAGSEVA
jgi:hypothetical protein